MKAINTTEHVFEINDKGVVTETTTRNFDQSGHSRTTVNTLGRVEQVIASQKAQVDGIKRNIAGVTAQLDTMQANLAEQEARLAQFEALQKAAKTADKSDDKIVASGS